MRKPSFLVNSITFAITIFAFSTGASAELTKFKIDSEYETYCGFKNDSGQIVVPAQYQYCGEYSEGMAYVGNMGKGKDIDNYYVGYVNESGDLVIPVRNIVENMYSNLMFKDFHEGLAPIYKLKANGYEGYYGYMNKTGELVIPYQYDSAGDFVDGKAVVCKAERCGVIDKSGKTIVPFNFNYLNDFSEGLASFHNDSGSGYIDTSGNIVIQGQWDGLMPFSEGRAAVKVGDYETGKWGVIDNSGNLIVPIQYDHAYIEPMGDSIETDGGIYENGTIDLYDIDEDYTRFTRYRFDRQGKLLHKKVFSSWLEIEAERHPEYSQ